MSWALALWLHAPCVIYFRPLSSGPLPPRQTRQTNIYCVPSLLMERSRSDLLDLLADLVLTESGADSDAELVLGLFLDAASVVSKVSSRPCPAT